MSTHISGPSWQQEVEAARSRAQSNQGTGYAFGRVAMATFLVLLVVIIVFSLELSFGLDRQELTMMMLSLATFVVASVPIVINQGIPSNRRHIFITLMGLLFIGSYVLPPLFYYIPSQPPTDAPGFAYSLLERPDLIVGQIFGLLGLSVMLIAYSLPFGRVLADRLPRPLVDWPLSTLITVSIVMLILGWGVLLPGAVGLIPGGWGSGFIGAFTFGTIYANVTLTLGWIRHRSTTALLLLALNILLGVAFGLVTTSKTQVLIRPFISAITFVLVGGKIRTRWLAAGLVALALLYPASNIGRNIRGHYPSLAAAVADPVGMLTAIGAQSARWDLGEWFETGLVATSHRVDALGATSVLVRDTPRRFEFQNGRTLALFFQAWVPRVIWPEKPDITIGRWVTSTYGSGPHIASNTAPSHIGEYYINFGALGVIFGMFLVGSLGRFAHESLMWRGGTAASILVMTVVLYQLILKFEAGIAGNYAGTIMSILPIWLIHQAVVLTLPTFRKSAVEKTVDDGPALAVEPLPPSDLHSSS